MQAYVCNDIWCNCTFSVENFRLSKWWVLGSLFAFLVTNYTGIHIFFCSAGLRLFKEANNRDSGGRVGFFFLFLGDRDYRFGLFLLLKQMWCLELGRSSSNNGSWCGWWNVRVCFPHSYVSWSIKIRVSFLEPSPDIFIFLDSNTSECNPAVAGSLLQWW